MTSGLRIGVDVGGTKIEAIAIDQEGRELARTRTPAPTGDYNRTLGVIVGLIAAVEGQAGRQAGAIGIGIPGTISPATKLVKNANSAWLIGHPLDRDLADRLGRPVRVENDANCFAVSEAADGAGAGVAVVFGVILGTGVGGGVVVRGQVLTGANAIAGEWGHNPLPWPRDTERPGHRCYCGHYGCIETFLSGPGFARDYAENTPDAAARVPADIEILAQRGDAAATAALRRYEERLARALATVINMLDPDVIVLGGGMSNTSDLYRAVPRLWTDWVFSDRVDTRLVKAKHGDSSGVRGAAWLWPVEV